MTAISQRPLVEEVEKPRPAARVIAIIPAHNEEIGIAQTIESLRRQTQAPDRILVAADNCTDGTVDIARAMGVEVLVTCDNTARKAG
ncbi:glycosyltransferase, partial [Escherichia coli]|uniref:glycosyltransferase n=1 Tax=Escherichia coli TaxID=562 RepID=UPI0032E51FC2